MEAAFGLSASGVKISGGIRKGGGVLCGYPASLQNVNLHISLQDASSSSQPDVFQGTWSQTLEGQLMASCSDKHHIKANLQAEGHLGLDERSEKLQEQEKPFC